MLMAAAVVCGGGLSASYAGVQVLCGPREDLSRPTVGLSLSVFIHTGLGFRDQRKGTGNRGVYSVGVFVENCDPKP